MKSVYICLILGLLLASCTEKSKVSETLDLRDISISHQDIELYTSLLSRPYLEHEGIHSIEKTKSLFARFDAIKMQSRDRNIQIIDESHAACEQTYILQVLADGEWRKIVQREQLELHKEEGAWRISSGL